MDVIHGRDIFFRWTKLNLDHYLSSLSEQQQLAIRLIPMIFQTNHRMLPAYVSADTPAGIYGYLPDKQLIADTRKINGRFHYEQQTALKNTLIDAVYLRPGLIDGPVTLVLFVNQDIEQKQKQELETKMQRLIRWLGTEHINCTGILQSAEKFKLDADELSNEQGPSADVSRDLFYFESILLAGKYPLWWLIPSDAELNYQKMVDHIQRARYVNEHEYIDLGPASTFNLNQLLKSLVDLMQQDYGDDSLLLRYCLIWQALSKHSTAPLSSSLKITLLDEKQDLNELTIEKIFVDIMEKIISTIFGVSQWGAIRVLYGKLTPFSESGIRPLLKMMSDQNSSDEAISRIAEHNLALFCSAKKSIQSFIVNVVDRIMEQVSTMDFDDSDEYSRLLSIYQNQFKDTDRISIINRHPVPLLIQDKILIREIPDYDSSSQWALVVKNSKNKEIQAYSMKSLLGLIAWVWINRLIDQSTQVSIESPGYQIRQIDVRHAMEVLVREISDISMDSLRKQKQEISNKAKKSLVFIRSIKTDHMNEYSGHINDKFAENELLIEQLVVQARGDVHYRFYNGSEGVMQCFCDWLNNSDIGDNEELGDFRVFSYSSGEINSYAIHIGMLYDEILGFFRTRSHESASFILRLETDYYIISQQNDQYSYQSITDELSFYQYLELPVATFNTVNFHRQVLSNTPLYQIYQNNRKGEVEFYFRLSAEQYDVWVLDERGSLWHSKQPGMDFEPMIAHWLYFINGVKNQYQKASMTVPEFQMYRVVNNGPGDYGFGRIDTKSINVNLEQPALVARCHSLMKPDEFSLRLGDEEFDFLEYGDEVVDRFVQYLSDIGATQNLWLSHVELDYLTSSVAVTDEIQFQYFLKLKRRIEFELRRKLEH